jgi:crossover junction endodeoxyribonuclease RuvC
MKILGIDPGAGGALAFFDPIAGTLELLDMPVMIVERNGKARREISEQMIAAVIGARSPNVAVVEKVSAMPGQGVTSMFSFGLAFGLVRGVLAGQAIPIELVTPQTWQKALGVRGGKDGSRQRACELFPAYAAAFARVKDNGRSDAALIAMWRAMQ